jgi:hypothetical protein
MKEGDFDVVEFRTAGYVGGKGVKSLENHCFEVCDMS